jgi:hypothetical protein
VGGEEAKIEEAINLIAQKVKPFEILPESNKEEDDEERIAPIMSSFSDFFRRN